MRFAPREREGPAISNNYYQMAYSVIPAGSVEEVIIAKYPTMDLGDHRLYRTLSRYVEWMQCSFAVRSDGNFLLIHKNNYVERITLAKLLRMALEECTQRQGKAHGYEAMCLEEDEEELLLLEKRYRATAEAYKARRAAETLCEAPAQDCAEAEETSAKSAPCAVFAYSQIQSSRQPVFALPIMS